MSALFRIEVAEAKSQEWIGRITLKPPAMGWWAVTLAIVVTVVLAAIAILGHYTTHVRADARLMPDIGLLSVKAGVDGTVTKVFITAGQAVTAGTPIAELSMEQRSDQGAALEKGMSQLLLKQKSLQNDVIQQAKIERSTRVELKRRITLLDSQIVQVSRQTVIQQQRADTTSHIYERWRDAVSSGAVSQLEILQKQDAALQLRAGVSELNRQRLALEVDLSKAETDLNQLTSTEQRRRDESQRSIADVDRAIAQSAASRTRIVVAPAKGTVTAVYVNIGQALSLQDPLVDIVPLHANIIAELWLPSSSMGAIAVGNQVILRYQPYPYRIFGTRQGTVSFVAQTPTPADTVEKLSGMNVTEPRYRITVNLKSQVIMVNGHTVSLRPGTRAEVDVLLKRRSLVDWLLDPVRSMRSNLQTVPTERN